jgi:hypothetical protein
MPTIRNSIDTGVGGTVANVLAGSQFEFLARPSIVQVYATQDPADLAEIEVFFGQELQSPQAPVSYALNAGEGPIVPNDEIVSDIGAPGDRIVIRVVETGGAATAIVRTMVKITPL